MNAVSSVNHYTNIINKIVSELDSLESFETNNLMSKLNLLQKDFLDLAKLTNDGKGSAELRTEKLKTLKKWLQDYSDKEKFLLQTVPQRLKNKPVAVDSTTLDKFEEYAQTAINYISGLPAEYKAIKARVLPFLVVRKQLFKNLDSFELDESDLLALAAEPPPRWFREPPVEAITHNPEKTIKTIRAVLRRYDRLIIAVDAKEQSILQLLTDFENTLQLKGDYTEEDILQVIYSQLNNRNKLLQSLVKNISNLRKTIAGGDFKHKLAIIKKYQSDLETFNKYLPEEVISKLSLTTLISPIEEELSKSPGQIKRYDPLKDQEMEWPESEEELPEIKPKEDMAERVDRALRHQELADISKETGMRPGKPTSPEEKQKYEQLWETASLQSTKKLTRIANYLETKYYQ